MNARTGRPWLTKVGGLLFGLCLASPALATGIPDVLDDPLWTRPPVLATGAVAYGEDMPIPCPPPVDLSQPLTLRNAVDLALCRNPQIKMAWAAIKMQAAAVGEARAAYLPTLTGSFSRLKTRNHFPNSNESDNTVVGQRTYAAVNWRLLDFGGRAANREATDRMLQAALASHDAVLQRALSSVVGTYFDALAARGAATARGDAARLAQETLNATQRREARGASGRNDTLQAAAALAKARLAEQRAKSDEAKTLALLVAGAGMPIGTRPLLAEQNEMPHTDAIRDLAAWLAAAEADHPALRAARAQVEAARVKVIAARSEGLPTLDWSANYYRNGYPNQALQTGTSETTTLGVTLTIPFFEGFARTYKIRGAEAQVEQSEAQRQDTEHQVLTEIVKAYADALGARENLSTSEALLEAANAALESAQRRYAKGAADILELLSMQSLLADAQQERVRCLAEWRAARLRLMANAGMLSRADVDR